MIRRIHRYRHANTYTISSLCHSSFHIRVTMFFFNCPFVSVMRTFVSVCAGIISFFLSFFLSFFQDMSEEKRKGRGPISFNSPANLFLCCIFDLIQNKLYRFFFREGEN